MGMPRKLKQFHLFANGIWIDDAVEFTLPKLTRNMEDFRSGGMSGPVKTDNGMNGLEAEWKIGGIHRSILGQWGETRHDGIQLRFVGAYQDDSTGIPVQVEIALRGRHEEMDHGSAKAGDDTEVSVKTVCSYYRLDWNGSRVHEIDFINGIEIIDGIDRRAGIRAALLA